MDAGFVDVHAHHLPRALAEALERRRTGPRIERADGRRHIVYGAGSGHPVLPEMEDLELRPRHHGPPRHRARRAHRQPARRRLAAAADGVAVARVVNDELAAIVAGGGGRLSALATLPAQDPAAAAVEVDRAVGVGLRGAAIFSNAAGRPLDDPCMQVVFDAAAALDVPLLVHPTFPLSAATVDAYALVPTLGFLIDRRRRCCGSCSAGCTTAIRTSSSSSRTRPA